MSGISKILAGTMIGAGVIAGFSYYKQLRKAQAELQIIPKANLYQLSWDGLTIRVDVLMKNPTKGSFKIKFPFVKLQYRETILGSSQAVNRDILIPPFGEAMIDQILVKIPVISLFSVAYTLVKALHNKEAVKVAVRTSTVIDIGIAQIPYEDKSDLTIKG